MRCIYLLRFLGKYLTEKTFGSYVFDEKTMLARKNTMRNRETKKKRKKEEQENS